MQLTRIWRNFLTLSAGETVARFLHAMAFFVIARRAGAETFGEFGLAVTMALYVSLLVQQGFDTVGVRAGAKDASTMKQMAARILALRIASGLAAALLLITYTLARNWSVGFKITLVLLSFGAMIRQLSPRWVLQAIETTYPIALANIFAQLAVLISALLVTKPEDLIWVGAGQLIGEVLCCAYIFRRVQPYIGWPALSWDGAAIWRESLPLTYTVIVGALLFSFDILAMDWLHRPMPEIGLYNAVYRCVNIFSMLVGSLQISILPLFARAYPDRSKAFNLAWRATRLSVPAGVGLALIFTVFGGQILGLLYGPSYSEGARLLAYLTWVMPLAALRGVLRQFLLAFRLQHMDAVNMSAALAVNVAFDFLLIPEYGPMGCVISTILSEITLTLLSAAAVRGIKRA